MDFIDRIRELAVRIPKQLEHIQTEEATKNALIMPFISALGYDVFNPLEVTPELSADVGVKKGEKVDYAILQEGRPIILFECKHHATDLAKAHASQLYRYFSVTEARFGVLTNGLISWFYTDLEAQNKMDSKPFFEFNLLDMRDQDVEELKKFSKSAFDVEGILSAASELKYTREIKRLLAQELAEPSDDLVKYFASQLQVGRMSQTAREQFAQATRRAFQQFITDQLAARFKTALGSDAQMAASDAVPSAKAGAESVAAEASAKPAIETTEDEREAFHIVRALLRETIDVQRIAMRDQQTYCGVLLDDNNRKPICRLWFNTGQKYISLFDGEQRKEDKQPITGLDDIYGFADRLRATVVSYNGNG